MQEEFKLVKFRWKIKLKIVPMLYAFINHKCE